MTYIALWPNPHALGPVTDLYQLTMMAGYAAEGMDRQRAVFELFVRQLNTDRSYLVFAGLEQALGDLLTLRFSEPQIDWLRALPAFRHIKPTWFATLRDLRFTGDVWAMPEGTVCFPGETLLRVEAPLAEAQWVETFLLASLAYPTMAASKAARIVEAARGRALYDFGARRGHGPHSGFLCARAAYLAGFAGTSHVEAARRLGIPCVGTMAHSWVQSFDSEPSAFAAFARHFPEATTLLVDTYDTLEGTRHAVAVEPPTRAIRLDSGNLGALAREARALLNSAGRPDVKILASGDLDEWKIADLVEAAAPIDSFGVGTELITVRDAPALSMVYKLVMLDGVGRIKLSPGKKTYPLAKQVWRRYDDAGVMIGDLVTAAHEHADGEALLHPVIVAGEWTHEPPPLDRVREYCRRQWASLPVALRVLDGTGVYPVAYSDLLENEAARLGVKA